METFVRYCRNYIEETLPEYVGRSYYLCDLGWTITEGPNCDGSLTYSTKLALDYLAEWRYEAAEYWEYEKFNFGEHMHNPFDNPEAYMVCMVIEGVRTLIDQALSELEMDGQWNDKVELTEDLAQKIIEKVQEINEINF